MKGDRVALGRLLLLHDQRLRRRVERRIPADLRSLLSIDDVLQETYIEAHRHIGRLEPRGAQAFHNWLAAIADRKLIDTVKALRAVKRTPPGGGRRLAVDRSTSFLGLAQLIDSRNKTPSGIVARREAVRALQVALASLPGPCRQVVWMRHIENRTPQEIAAAIGRTERAVHQLCYRGLRRLREKMGNRSKFLSDSR